MILEGHPAREIRRHAVERSADLVVVGAHGRHGWRLLLGSTANAVLRGLACDVLCMHIPGEARRFRENLVAVDTVLRPLDYTYARVDLSAYSDAATRIAREASDRARAGLDDLTARFGLTGERLVRHGHAAREIHALTDQVSADLVVLGTHERHGLGWLAGSTANAVLHGAKSDVLAVRV